MPRGVATGGVGVVDWGARPWADAHTFHSGGTFPPRVKDGQSGGVILLVERRGWWDPDMGDLRIGTASRDELGAVLDFWKTAAEGTSISDDLTGIERLHARDPEALLLARRGPAGGGDLVGTVIAGFDGWRCHLYRLAVHPGHRRQGIAAALLAAAEARFVALGGRRGDAMVLDRNESAHRAWEAAGYRAEAQWSRWVKPLR